MRLSKGGRIFGTRCVTGWLQGIDCRASLDQTITQLSSAFDSDDLLWSGSWASQILRPFSKVFTGEVELAAFKLALLAASAMVVDKSYHKGPRGNFSMMLCNNSRIFLSCRNFCVQCKYKNRLESNEQIVVFSVFSFLPRLRKRMRS